MKDKQHYNARYPYGARIIDEAADWFTRLQDTELSCEDREAFADWLSASPEHVREYLTLANLHADIGELPPTRSVEDLVELAGQGHPENVISLNAVERVAKPDDSPASGTGRAGRVKRIAALAAGLVVIALACVWWLYPHANVATYTTSIGEQKSFPLSDGSIVTLNAVSKLRIHYTEQYRDVQLLSGEALFAVAKNKLRPFRVLTNDSVIQAVGTQFNVNHRYADTTVTVVEGTVEIRPVVSQPQFTRPAPASEGSSGEGLGARSSIIRVTKGQRAHVDAQDAAITVSTVVDATVDTAWRERHLTFESRPLGEVVAEFNLYNEHPIEIRDAGLNSTQVSGSFNANDPQSFALFLEAAKLAKPKIESDKILLMPMATP